MIVVLRPGSTAADVAEVLQEMQRHGLAGRVLQTGGKPVVHVLSGRTRRARKLVQLDQVEAVVPTSGPRVRREGWRFFPYHFVNWSAFGVVLLGVLVFLAGMYPPGIGEEVDYRHPPDTVTQPWYLRLPLAFVHLFPRQLSWLGWLLLAFLALVVLLLPMLDRTRADSRAGAWLRAVVALCVVVAVALVTWKGGVA